MQAGSSMAFLMASGFRHENRLTDTPADLGAERIVLTTEPATCWNICASSPGHFWSCPLPNLPASETPLANFVPCTPGGAICGEDFNAERTERCKSLGPRGLGIAMACRRLLARGIFRLMTLRPAIKNKCPASGGRPPIVPRANRGGRFAYARPPRSRNDRRQGTIRIAVSPRLRLSAWRKIWQEPCEPGAVSPC